MRLVETVNRGEIIKSFSDGYQTLPHYSLFIGIFGTFFLFHVKQKGKPKLPLSKSPMLFSDCFT
jgi:hypothetical protein